MIRLMPVESPNLRPGETQNDVQQFIVYADEPVTIGVLLTKTLDGKPAIRANVYRGVLAEDDQETRPLCGYSGSDGHVANEEFDSRLTVV